MKSTIKLDTLHSIVVQPNAEKTGMLLELVTCGVTAITKTLTFDQAEVMTFGLERVLAVMHAQAEGTKRMAA